MRAHLAAAVASCALVAARRGKWEGGRANAGDGGYVKGVGVAAPEAFVNTLGGTDSRYDLSHGNLLPLVVRPWGASAWAPQTDTDPSYSSWW
jgi:putative alpha-1,2-mannosidase